MFSCGSSADCKAGILPGDRREVALYTDKSIDHIVVAVVFLSIVEVGCGMVGVDHLLGSAEHSDKAHGAGVGEEVEHAEALTRLRDIATSTTKIEKQRWVEFASTQVDDKVNSPFFDWVRAWRGGRVDRWSWLLFSSMSKHQWVRTVDGLRNRDLFGRA